MNILICDDMPTEADKLAGLFAASGFAINTVTFYNAGDALNYIRSGALVDICFLDIIMPEMSGVTLAKQLRADGFKGRIVFLSASHEYGPETYTVKAFSYLLKPPTAESVKNILRELDEALKNDDTGGILVKSLGISRLVLFREISHIEVINHKVYLRLTDGAVLETRATFSEVALQLLCEGRFTQCHRSYIINMDEVSAVQGNNFVMRGGENIPISKSYAEAKSRYIRCVLGRIGK